MSVIAFFCSLSLISSRSSNAVSIGATRYGMLHSVDGRTGRITTHDRRSYRSHSHQAVKGSGGVSPEVRQITAFSRPTRVSVSELRALVSNRGLGETKVGPKQT